MFMSTTFSSGQLSAGATYYWRIDVGNSKGLHCGRTWRFTTNPGAADVDGDSDVDDDDVILFADCLLGPVVTVEPVCLPTDLTLDNQVSLRAVARWQQSFGGVLP